MARKFTRILLRMNIKSHPQTYMTRVEGENTRLRHPDSSVKTKDSLLFWHQTASCSDIQLSYLFIISSLMMFAFHIQLIIPSEHYSPHAIAKPYPHSATPPHFGNKLMGEIPMLWELPVSREAVKSKYNKLLQREHYSPQAIAKPYPHSATPPHFGNKLMGEIPMLWELPVSREAVKSKYNKLLLLN